MGFILLFFLGSSPFGGKGGGKEKGTGSLAGISEDSYIFLARDKEDEVERGEGPAGRKGGEGQKEAMERREATLERKGCQMAGWRERGVE